MTERMSGRPARGGDEADAFSRASVNAHTWRPGERARIKARYNRRTRRAGRQTGWAQLG